VTFILFSELISSYSTVTALDRASSPEMALAETAKEKPKIKTKKDIKKTTKKDGVSHNLGDFPMLFDVHKWRKLTKLMEDQFPLVKDALLETSKGAQNEAQDHGLSLAVFDHIWILLTVSVAADSTANPSQKRPAHDEKDNESTPPKPSKRAKRTTSEKSKSLESPPTGDTIVPDYPGSTPVTKELKRVPAAPATMAETIHGSEPIDASKTSANNESSKDGESGKKRVKKAAPLSEKKGTATKNAERTSKKRSREDDEGENGREKKQIEAMKPIKKKSKSAAESVAVEDEEAPQR
jgi:hypothetical protein